MIDIIDGFKAGGCGKIFAKYLLHLILTLINAIVLTGLFRFSLGKEEIIPVSAGFVGALISVVLVFIVNFMRAVIKNGEHPGRGNAT